MKDCPNCKSQIEDNAAFCPNCGAPLNSQTAFDAHDHTSEFTEKDISDNKVIAMLVYLAGYIGIIIALIAAPSSPYVGFHLRQALKIEVISILSIIAGALLCWTFVVPVAAMLVIVVLTILKIVAFFRVCKGQAKEIPVISDFKFMK